MWRPDSGQSPNRGFVRASEPVWLAYHRQLRSITLRWLTEPQGRGEFDHEFGERCDAAAKMREVDLHDLHKSVREHVLMGHAGPYLIPV